MPTYTSSTSNGYRVRIIVDLLEQDIAGNRSRIRSRFQIMSTRVQSNYVARSTGRHRTAGTTRWSISGVTERLNGNQTRTMHTDTRWYAHKADGTLTVSFDGNFQTVQQGSSWSFPPRSVSGSYTLPRIARGPRVRHSGSWRPTIAYVRHGSRWRVATPYVRHGGRWRVAGR